MCTPALGWQMLAVSWLSIFLSESVNGPVALMTHLARTSNSLPVREEGRGGGKGGRGGTKVGGEGGKEGKGGGEREKEGRGGVGGQKKKVEEDVEEEEQEEEKNK